MESKVYAKQNAPEDYLLHENKLRTLKKSKKQKKRSIREQKKKEPKVFENPKKALIMKGHKTSEIINYLLNDLNDLKKPFSLKFNNKQANPQKSPFEETTQLEFLLKKNDCSLFAMGLHSKKRPNNLILGRTYNYNLLDMIEFGVTNYKPTAAFTPTKAPQLGDKPCFTITGAEFEQNPTWSQAANLFVDFFRGEVTENICLAGIDHVISLTPAGENTIAFKHFYVHFKKSGTRVPRVELEEIGPSMDLIIRRTHFATESLRKETIKAPRELQMGSHKNVTYNQMGDKVGTVYTNRQDLEKLNRNTKKAKALRIMSKRKREDQVEIEEVERPMKRQKKEDE